MVTAYAFLLVLQLRSQLNNRRSFLLQKQRVLLLTERYLLGDLTLKRLFSLVEKSEEFALRAETLLLQPDVVLLDAADEYLTEATHVGQLVLHPLEFLLQVSVAFFDRVVLQLFLGQLLV